MEQLIYKHSDFKLRETLSADMAGVPFIFDYFVVKNGKRYTASYDGAQYVNCANDNGVIVVCFDAPCFECGKLKAERRFTLQDDHFSDKSYNPVGLYELGIRITNDPTHIPGGDVSSEIAPAWAVGPAGNSAYKDAVEQGFVGTLDEWLASLKMTFSDLTDAEKAELKGAGGLPGKIQRLVVNGQAVEADEAGTATFNVESSGGSGMTTEQATLLGTAEQLETTAKTLPTAVNELKAENAQLGRELGQITYKKVGEYIFKNDRRILEIASVDFVAQTITLTEPHGIINTSGWDCFCYPILFGNEDAQPPLYGNSPIFAAAVEQLNFMAKPTLIIDEYTLKFAFKTSSMSTANFDKNYYRLMVSSDGNYQRRIEFSEECSEYMVSFEFSHSSGSKPAYDSSVEIKHSVGFSYSESKFTNATPYNRRMVCTAIHNIKPKYNNTNGSIGGCDFYTEVDRNGLEKGVITSFGFYSYSVPYYPGDKITIYKIS